MRRAIMISCAVSLGILALMAAALRMVCPGAWELARNRVTGATLAEEHGVRWFSRGGQYGLMDAAGNVLIEPRFAGVEPWRTWYTQTPAAVVTGVEGSGLVDTAGNVLLEPKYRFKPLIYGEVFAIWDGETLGLGNARGALTSDGEAPMGFRERAC